MDPTGAAVGALIKEVVSSVRQWATSPSTVKPDLASRLLAHLRSVDGWSGQIQFLGMSRPLEIETASIPLKINATPRRFRARAPAPAQLNEVDLLTDKHHYILLGDPGSGKTTTVKRLARRLLRNPPDSYREVCQYPIVIRAHELRQDMSLAREIADTVGIIYERAEYTTEDGEIAYEFRSEGIPLDDAVKNFLDQTTPLLLVDGIDEADPSRKLYIDRELADLAAGAGTAKIIVTCRSGEYARGIDGYRVVEIAEIADPQITMIIDKWAESPSAFREAIAVCPYRDIINRPLFLTQLILIFNNTRYLPQKPTEVYSRILTLMLEKWDFERRIYRKTQYSSFTPDQKFEFLSALSFDLTYQMKDNKAFTEAALGESYKRICAKFGLPTREMEEVVREIESHTGILIKSSFDTFEFSHLSLQEYLAAYYIVREPFVANIQTYLQRYSPPLAIAVALSSNPSGWLAIILLKFYLLPYFDRTLGSLLHRIMLERPYFTVDAVLGLGILRILADIDYDNVCLRQHPGSRIDIGLIQRFIEADSIRESVMLALGRFAVLLYEWRDSENKDAVPFERTTNSPPDDFAETIKENPISGRMHLDRRLLYPLLTDGRYGVQVRSWRGAVSLMRLKELRKLVEES